MNLIINELFNDGDVKLEYTVDTDELIEIKYTKFYSDSDDVVNSFEIYVDELEDLMNRIKKSINDRK